VIGGLLLTLGALVGLYAAWELFYTDVIAEEERTRVARDWRHDSTSIPRPHGPGPELREDFPVLEGEGTLGVLHVPRWGEGYQVPIAHGTGADVLDTGQLGHYAGTQPIGAPGNAGLAGHRTSHGKPLREVHRLEPGDAIVVESEEAWLVYRMVAADIVAPHEAEVLDPVRPFDGAGRGRYLTLTTCEPIFGVTERYIVWAEADYWTPKGEGIAPDLAPEAEVEAVVAPAGM
jgi:sortase A